MIEEVNIAKRYEDNPIIYPEISGLAGEKGENINGPSLIKVPDWIQNPLGEYYLYFAHHGGEYIRLAYADKLKGPWKVYEPGTLSLEETVCREHIGSPDVHVDENNKKIRMYFHGPYQDHQKSFVGFSDNGIDFEANSEVLGDFYFRVFQYKNDYYAIAKNGNKGGIILRSEDGVTPFEKCKEIIPNLRHTAVYIENNILYLFYTKMRDKPEKIYLSYIDLTQDYTDWEVSSTVTVLKTEKNYEGVNQPIKRSQPGSAEGYVHQLRDPAIYSEDNKFYLLYSVAGEKGIALAELSNGFKDLVK